MGRVARVQRDRTPTGVGEQSRIVTRAGMRQGGSGSESTPRVPTSHQQPHSPRAGANNIRKALRPLIERELCAVGGTLRRIRGGVSVGARGEVSRTQATSPGAAPAARPGAARVGRRRPTTLKSIGLNLEARGFSWLSRISIRELMTRGIGESPRNSPGPSRGGARGRGPWTSPPNKRGAKN